ncbi:TPA_asm: hypothetical protein G4G51_004760 [Salmonella enterica subsp. enterica serovar Dublin]|uniref:Uncharacterized protein n=1 Tax=Salmonella dublin TaxID=98360 RepID=A0A732D6I3_SALDU|nr:hypothetical protein [Salmonella enterica subsp. enterica serovar Dublin]EKR1405100.1 hypothetical protein [Salmonella enterica subsp. enterica serovar Dublin]HAE4980088.1 hypothetical protein [Salmonella enterica subsp. enterica serovar Dublin]
MHNTSDSSITGIEYASTGVNLKVPEKSTIGIISATTLKNNPHKVKIVLYTASETLPI